MGIVCVGFILCGVAFVEMLGKWARWMDIIAAVVYCEFMFQLKSVAFE